MGTDCDILWEDGIGVDQLSRAWQGADRPSLTHFIRAALRSADPHVRNKCHSGGHGDRINVIDPRSTGGDDVEGHCG
jgi:hypothetical protein